MSSFSALKTAIQAAIKQNGNNEITGDILQDILLSIVSTLGDSAINTLEQGLQIESQTRGNDDAALSQAIEDEATARENQDTQLGNLITGIKNNIDNGYVYAGIAIPSITPVSGKVFYIATQAGTYTNLGNTAVKPGISILKYNGSAWSNEQVIYTDGGVFDVSAYNGGATYASLEALLSDANLSTIIPSAVRKGGMSIKFVHTSDNKYIQARLMANTFTTDVTQWQGVDDEPTVGSDNLVKSGGVYQIYAEINRQNVKIGTNLISFNHIGYLKADGTYGTNPNLTCKNIVMNCKSGEVYQYKGRADGGAVSALFFSNGEILSSVQINSQDNYVDITIPQNADFVIFSSYNDTTPILDIKVNNNITENLTALNTDFQPVKYSVQNITNTYVPLKLTEQSINTDFSNSVILYEDGSKTKENGCIISQVIKLAKGDCIVATVKAYNTTATLSKSFQNIYTPLAKGKGLAAGLVNYYYYATEDCDIRISGFLEGMSTSVISNIRYSDIIELINNIEPDLTPILHNGYLRSDGTVGGTTNAGVYGKHTSKLKCNEGDVFLYKGLGEYSAVSVVFYNGNTVLSSAAYNSVSSYRTITIPQNCNGVIFASYGASLSSANEVILDVIRKSPASFKYLINETERISEVIPQIQEDVQELQGNAFNILTNKKWVACGDSYTHGESGIASDVWTDEPYLGMRKTYPYWIGRRSHMVIVDAAVAGRTLAYKDGTHYEFSAENGPYTQIPTDTDYITLWFGINDCANNIPVGTINDNVNTTFYGAWNIVLTWIQTNIPNAKVGIVVSNNPGSGFANYAEATRQAAKKYGIPFLDLQDDYSIPYFLFQWERQGVAQSTKDTKDAFFRVSSSNLHPNVKAHEYESSFIEDWLRSL